MAVKTKILQLFFCLFSLIFHKFLMFKPVLHIVGPSPLSH